MRLVNGARGATSSEYMSLCITEHVPKDADLVSSRRGTTPRTPVVGGVVVIWTSPKWPESPPVVNHEILQILKTKL